MMAAEVALRHLSLADRPTFRFLVAQLEPQSSVVVAVPQSWEGLQASLS